MTECLKYCVIKTVLQKKKCVEKMNAEFSGSLYYPQKTFILSLAKNIKRNKYAVNSALH